LNEGEKMAFEIVGKRAVRKDAAAKVTGRAKYADDFFERDMLVGKVLRSPYAHAIVKSIDTGKAKALPGVEAVITHEDLPKLKYATAGHPWSLDPGHRDVADRYILTDKARYVGDGVAAVVAVDALTAEKALKLIEVEYEVLPFVLDPEKAMLPGAPVIHEERPDNILGATSEEIGNIEEDFKKADYIFEGVYETSIVQHCHPEYP
jgi:xanthine dehydrogenase molybdenum-binding subunit